MMKLSLTLALLLALAACASPAHKPAETKEQSSIKVLPATVENNEDLLLFCDRFSELSPDMQKQTWQETHFALQQNKLNIANRIKQAAMLALPDSKLRDLPKAQTQLRDLLQENLADPKQNALVGLLYEYTAEQQRLLSKVREEAKKTDTAQQKAEATQQKLDALQSKFDALQQKLNELRNLEKTLLQRNKPSQVKP